MPRPLFIVDDDLLTREVLTILGEEAGFAVTSFDSGEAALAHLALHPAAPPPSAVLCDMQMPGLAGDALAARLRPVCGPGALLIAMSGSPVEPSARRRFDDFLLKPFDFAGLNAALAHAPVRQQLPPPAPTEVLHAPTYRGLAQAMPRQQLDALYALCLDDAERRLAGMRDAAVARDGDSFSRGAHSIKGGCGLVGAQELAAIAATMEEEGLPGVGDLGAFDEKLAAFRLAAARLRSMLESPT